MRAFAVVFATLLCSASAIPLKAEPESEEHHFFNRRDSTDRQLAELNEQIQAAEEGFVKDLQAEKPGSVVQVKSGFAPQSEDHHHFDSRDASDRELAEIDDIDDEIHAEPASFLQVDADPKEHYFDRRDSTDRELAEIDNEIHAAEENFVQDVSKPTSFLQLSADPENSLEVNDQPEVHVDPSAAWEADDAKEMALEAKPHEVIFINGLSMQAPQTEADIQEEKDFAKSVVSLKEKAKPKEDEKEAKADEIKYDEKKFAKDFGSEWKNGDYPSYKKTYSKDAFPGRKAVVAAEDSQSDGKPSKGLRGPNVGAYLKHEADGTITR